MCRFQAVQLLYLNVKILEVIFVKAEQLLKNWKIIRLTSKNEWYPWGLQISLHIQSPAFSEMGGGTEGGGYSGVNFGHLKSEVFRNRGGGIPE